MPTFTFNESYTCDGFSISYDDYDTPGATPNPAFDWNLLGFYGPGTESQTVNRTGGVEPINYVLSAGSFPQGWQLDAATGELSKTSTLTPVASGSFTIEATDSTDATATATVTWNVV